MATFGLIHGAYHGAWCWELLTPELERRGHRVLTVDLPAEDPDAGAAAYATTAIEAFAGAGAELVLVGHSLGGLTAPVIAAARPVRRIVYLSAMIPRPGRAYDDVLEEEPDTTLPPAEDGAFLTENGASCVRPDVAARWLFSDCRPEIGAWAAARLRAQCWTIMQEVTPLEAWPDVPCSYVLGRADPVINPVWSRRACHEVLGVEAIELEAGHSTFLSVPASLAGLLTQLAGG